MASLEMPDLDKLYREAGLRNSWTKDKSSREVDFVTAFYSFGDFKRELRALLIVPIISIKETLKLAVEAISNLLLAAVQLATLDGRGFDSLGDFFVNTHNAIQTLSAGIYDTVGSFMSMYTRTLATVFSTIGKLFENEPNDSEALKATAALTEEPSTGLRSNSMFAPAPAQSRAQKQQLERQKEIERLIAQGVPSDEAAWAINAEYNSGQQRFGSFSH